jgi:hypothetical protein
MFLALKCHTVKKLCPFKITKVKEVKAMLWAELSIGTIAERASLTPPPTIAF